MMLKQKLTTAVSFRRERYNKERGRKKLRLLSVSGIKPVVNLTTVDYSLQAVFYMKRNKFFGLFRKKITAIYCEML